MYNKLAPSHVPKMIKIKVCMQCSMKVILKKPCQVLDTWYKCPVTLEELPCAAKAIAG